MAENTVDISEVPVDVDPMEVGTIVNPLTEDFVHQFAGKDVVVPAATIEEVADEKGKVKKVLKPGRLQKPLPVCVHIAKHLAEKIIRDEFRRGIEAIKDEKKRYEEERKAIPRYQSQIFAKMAELVETDSDFFSKEGNEQKFAR